MSLKSWWNSTKKKVKKGFEDIGNWVKDTFDVLTGKTATETAKDQLTLAKDTEQWNESFSEKQLKQNDEQFLKTQELAQENLDYQKEYAEKNFNLQQSAFLEQQKENALMRAREDTAFQRQVEDLKAAGLSPLAVSGGASSQGATVGSAPQYDMSGVSTAQGSMINLAQQYAALRNEAMGNYSNRKISARNAQIAAKQVLGEVALQRRSQGIQFASQLFNARMAQKEFNLKSRQVDEQIQASKDQRSWMNEHGYRNQNWLSVLLPVFSKIADKFNFNSDSLAEAISNLPQKIGDVLNKGDVRNNLPEQTNKLTEKCTKQQLEELLLFANMNISYTDKDLHKIAESYAPLLPNNRSMTADNFYNWLKRDGVKEVLNLAFGLNYIK